MEIVGRRMQGAFATVVPRGKRTKHVLNQVKERTRYHRKKKKGLPTQSASIMGMPS